MTQDPRGAFLRAYNATHATLELANVAATGAAWHSGHMRSEYGTLNRGIIARGWPERHRRYLERWRSDRWHVLTAHLGAAVCHCFAVVAASRPC